MADFRNEEETKCEIESARERRNQNGGLSNKETKGKKWT
jgi:hypothetical protein